MTLTLMAALFLGQKIPKQDWMSALIAYIGVIIIATKGNITDLNFDNPLGLVLLYFSVYCGRDIECKKPSRSSDRALTWFYFFVAISISLNFYNNGWNDIPWQGWLSVSYVGLFEIGITFILCLKAIKFATNTSRISNFIFISPFIVLTLLATIIGEKIHPETLIGLTLIIADLLIWQRKTKNT